MTNPYDVLGVSPVASEEAIKNAYREKARAISSQCNPNGTLTASAQEQMQALDAAYDSAMAQKRGNTFNNSANHYDGYSQQNNYSQSGDASSYGAIRNALRAGNIEGAQAMLNNIPDMSRTAEWFYLQGMVYQQKGWTNAAYENYQKAYQIEPSNPEYERAFQAMSSNRNGGYRAEQADNSSSSSCCGVCDICQGLICADCCCECMGGDLISCC